MLRRPKAGGAVFSFTVFAPTAAMLGKAKRAATARSR